MEESKRQSQVTTQIKQIAGKALLDLEFPGECLVTVTRVTIAPDFANSSIFLSVIPNHCWNGVKNVLKKERSTIQQEIAANMTIHTTPSIRFILDERETYARKMEALLDDVAKNG